MKRVEKYIVIREYKNDFQLEELIQRIIRIHIPNDENRQSNKGCSDHEVQR